MDTITIRNIRSYGYTGFLVEERNLGQWFEVDLELALDLTEAGRSDVLDDSVDYRQIITTTKHLIKTAKFELVERLAEAIASNILTFKKVLSVRVKLTKPNPPIEDFDGQVVIDITRNK